MLPSIPEYRYSSTQRASAWATGGVRGKYIWPLPVISPVSDVNHYWFSFGLDDRYDDPYWDKVLYSYIGTCPFNGVTPPKLQALARRDTPALAH